MARFLDLPAADPNGLRREADLPYPLPYHLRAQDVLRMVEDLYELLHDLNVQLDSKGYDRLEELLDPAGFSGLISRSVVDGIAKFSRALVKNRFHNGYPDLLPKNTYAGDAVQHGTLGGLEVKASRSEGSWQSHGPRAGWFCVVQFSIDSDIAKAVRDREPTTVSGVYVAELSVDDWSWQPAGAGRIRSGTASILPTGREKLRSNAVWIDPSYEGRHGALVMALRVALFRSQADTHVLGALTAAARPIKLGELADQLAVAAGVPTGPILTAVKAALRKLTAAGRVRVDGRGSAAIYMLSP
jgi:hypothetical protein